MEKKVMSDYSLYCTETQTRKALNLGAPISYLRDSDGSMSWELDIPTAEQMIGWLEEQLKQKQYDIFDVTIAIEYSYDKDWGYFFGIEHFFNFNSRKEATLAAIDAALEYLTNNKK